MDCDNCETEINGEIIYTDEKVLCLQCSNVMDTQNVYTPNIEKL